MYNEFNKHKKSDGVKWVIVFVAIILLATSVVAIATKGFTQADPFGWFSEAENKTEPDETPETGKDEGDDLLYNVTGSEMMTLSVMKFNSSAPDGKSSGLQLKATPIPNNAVVGRYMWSIDWVDCMSDFAYGKQVSDYLHLDPDEVAGTATITVLQPFGEPICVTVWAETNPNAFALCQVDYSRKLATTQELSGPGHFFMESIMENDGRYGVLQIQPGTTEQLYNNYCENGAVNFSCTLSDVYTVDSYCSYEYEVTMCIPFYEALQKHGLLNGDAMTSVYLSSNFTVAELINMMLGDDLLPTVENGQTVNITKLNTLNEILFMFDGSDIFDIYVYASDSQDDHCFMYHIYANAAELYLFPEGLNMNYSNIVL